MVVMKDLSGKGPPFSYGIIAMSDATRQNATMWWKQLSKVAKDMHTRATDAAGKTNLTAATVLSGILSIGAMTALVMWIARKLSLKRRQCASLDALYATRPPIASIPRGSSAECHQLRDFYVKTAYNCCAVGDFKNDYVDLCALKACIMQGARCLDFAIYTVNEKAVVAVSGTNDYRTKGSYNSISVDKVMEAVRDYAFNPAITACSEDPLIIHLRFKTSQKASCEQTAESLYKHLEDHILGREYSYEYNGQNLGAVPFKDLRGKVVIIADGSNPLFRSTKLDEYVNASSGGAFMRSARNAELKTVSSVSEIQDFNKKNMTFVMPDVSNNASNADPGLAMKFGCQFVAMNFQKMDAYLERYILSFDELGSAFALKPEILRYVPKKVPAPPPQNPSYSYQTRVIPMPYGDGLSI